MSVSSLLKRTGREEKEKSESLSSHEESKRKMTIPIRCSESFQKNIEENSDFMTCGESGSEKVWYYKSPFWDTYWG